VKSSRQRAQSAAISRTSCPARKLATYAWTAWSMAWSGQMIGEGDVAAADWADFAAGARIDLPVHGVLRLAFDNLAGGEAEDLRTGSPPPAGRFPGQGGVEVVTVDGACGSGLGLGLPDVAEVVALGDG
jgi:hypothetical protein